MELNLFEKLHVGVVLILGFSLIALHAIYPSLGIDTTTVYILVIISLIPFIKYVSKISLPGGSLDLEREVQKVSNEVEQIINPEQVEQAQDASSQFNAFVKYITEIAERDADLAIMKLRTELEIQLKSLYLTHFGDTKKFNPITAMVNDLFKNNLIDENTKNTTIEVASIANKINHGEHIRPEYSESMITTTLNLIAFYYNLHQTIITKKQQEKNNE